MQVRALPPEQAKRLIDVLWLRPLPLVSLSLAFSVADGTFSANGVSLKQGSNHNTTTVLFEVQAIPSLPPSSGSSYRCFSPARSS